MLCAGPEGELYKTGVSLFPLCAGPASKSKAGFQVWRSARCVPIKVPVFCAASRFPNCTVSAAVEVGAGVESENVYRYRPHLDLETQLSFEFDVM